MLVVLIVSLVLSLAVEAQQPPNCTLTQTGWRESDVAQAGDLELVCQLCGLGSEALLQSDVARQLQPQNTLWLLASHQYCAATLNVWATSPIASQCDTQASGIGTAVLLLGDSLQYACANMSQWALLPALNDALNLLLLFNQGQQEGCEACMPGQVNGTDNVTTFYYYQSPDTITLRLHSDNTTLSYSLVKGRSDTTLALSLVLLGAIILIVLLLLLCVILNNRNRAYALEIFQKSEPPQQWSEIDHSGLDGEIELHEHGSATSDLELNVSIHEHNE